MVKILVKGPGQLQMDGDRIVVEVRQHDNVGAEVCAESQPPSLQEPGSCAEYEGYLMATVGKFVRLQKCGLVANGKSDRIPVTEAMEQLIKESDGRLGSPVSQLPSIDL